MYAQCNVDAAVTIFLIWELQHHLKEVGAAPFLAPLSASSIEKRIHRYRNGPATGTRRSNRGTLELTVKHGACAEEKGTDLFFAEFVLEKIYLSSFLYT
jgi:hypothetical protein